MSITIEELLELIPFDTQERVERAKNRFNLAIREALRQEIALRLTHNDGDLPPASQRSRDRKMLVVKTVEESESP